MIQLQWVFFNLLPILGFFLAITLVVHQSRAQRSPSSTLAWLLAILLVPYVGVPAYIFFGGRKIRRMIKNKHNFFPGMQRAGEPVTSQKSGAIFPRRVGNEVSLLTSGKRAYDSVIELIDHAQKSIDIATFILGNDETGAAIVAAVARKAKQGVRVRLLLDALGSFHVSKKMLAPLLSVGGQCAFFMPMMHLPFRGRANLRNHRKIIIIDQVTAMVGGMNFTRENMGTTPDQERWHDLSFIVKGPVTADLHRIFSSDWQFAARQKMVPEEVPVPLGTATTTLQIVPSGPDVVGDPLHDSIITAIFKAQQRVWIVTPYFIPDEILLNALCIAARRGIEVRIVLPRVSNHPLADLVRRGYLRQIQECGATISNFFAHGMLHGKVILVDDSLGIVGSMNMDMRSFFLNYEVALFVYDEPVVKELEFWIAGLIGRSEQGIKKTNVGVEFIEGVARLLSPLL